MFSSSAEEWFEARIRGPVRAVGARLAECGSGLNITLRTTQHTSHSSDRVSSSLRPAGSIGKRSEPLTNGRVHSDLTERGDDLSEELAVKFLEPVQSFAFCRETWPRIDLGA